MHDSCFLGASSVSTLLDASKVKLEKSLVGSREESRINPEQAPGAVRSVLKTEDDISDKTP